MNLVPVFRCLLSATFALLPVSLCTIGAQDLKPTPQQMRNNLALASNLAAIESEGAAPFRLEATFSTFDYLGKPAGEGMLQETWLRPGVAHRVITFRGERSDQISRNGSVRETATGFDGSFMERRILAALLDAVPEGKTLPEDASLSYKAYKVGNGTLDCVIVKTTNTAKDIPSQDGPATAYCVEPTTHYLRLRQERYDFAVVYNNLATLRGHTLAKQIRISQGGKLRANLSVTSFVAANDLTEKDFVLPGNSADLSHEEIPLPLSEEVVAGGAVRKMAPVYPASAKQNHISGTVFLSAIISKEGNIRELDVISSPSPDLTASAIAAVRLWKYKPYLIGGRPTEVDTTIRVNYAFN